MLEIIRRIRRPADLHLKLQNLFEAPPDFFVR